MVKLLHSLEAPLAKVAGGRSILFCSARAGEGKTTVVAEFAAVLVKHTGGRVAVVDVGLRHDLCRRHEPWPHIRAEQLLARLQGRRGEADPVIQERCIFVTAAANTPESRGLMEQRGLWAALKTAFDYTLVEMPALADSPLAVGTARHFDGVVLVIESGRTRWPIAQNAQDQLERGGATILGALLNKRVYHVPDSLYNRL